MANSDDDAPCRCGHSKDEHKEEGNWSPCERCGCLAYDPEDGDATS